MAALPDNNTGRVWVEYSNGQDQHTLLWRYNSTAHAVSAVLDGIASFFTAVEAAFYTFSIVSVRFAIAGSSVSLPVAWPGDPSYGTGTSTANDRAAALQFLGRSATGRRCSFWIYAVDGLAPIGYRLTASGVPAISDGIDALNSLSADGLYTAIDNTDPIHYPYANWKINDYWLHQAR